MMKEQSRDYHNVIKVKFAGRSFLRPLLAEALVVTSAKSRLFQFQVINTKKWLVLWDIHSIYKLVDHSGIII